MELSFFIVLSAGLATFLSPCILPLIPTYLAYITGISAKDIKNSKKTKVFFSTITFILGFTTAFVTLQFLLVNFANAVSSVLSKKFFYPILGIIVIFFGLQIIGLLNLRFLMFEKKIKMNIPSTNKPFFTFILGFLFVFGWSPCMGPILFSVIAYTSQSETITLGLFYLIVYSLGIGLPLLIFSLFFEKLKFLNNFMKNYYSLIEKISGLILILMGILLFFDKFSLFNNFN